MYRLIIKKPGQSDWKLLSSQEVAGSAQSKVDAFNYLKAQQNEWIANGGNDYFNAEYRIETSHIGWQRASFGEGREITSTSELINA